VETAVWECELGVSKLEIYWNVTPYNLGLLRKFGEEYSTSISTLEKLEDGDSRLHEMLEHVYQTKRSYILEGHSLG
jgi:hypothetical protein